MLVPLLDVCVPSFQQESNRISSFVLLRSKTSITALTDFLLLPRTSHSAWLQILSFTLQPSYVQKRSLSPHLLPIVPKASLGLPKRVSTHVWSFAYNVKVLECYPSLPLQNIARFRGEKPRFWLEFCQGCLD